MYSRKTVVVNPSGLHARPASDFMQAAMKFRSDITVGPAAEEARVNAKSMIMIIGLGVGQGTEIELTAVGDDEKEAVDTLVALVESGIGET